MAQFSSDDTNTALEAEVIRQQQIIASLQQQMETMLATQRPAIQTPNYIPKIALPEKFHGKRSEFNAFLGQLGLQFTNYPEHYASPMNRMKLFGSLLEGQAKQWFTANFMFNAEIIPVDWETFLKKARQHFGLLEPGKDAVAKLATLTQSGTIERYVLEFQSLVSQLPQGEREGELLRGQFIRGLSQKTYIVLQNRGIPSRLQDCYDDCLKISSDQLLREGSFFSSTTPRPNQTSHTAASDAMDVDAIGRRTHLKKKLTPEERKLRFENNLCLYCGSPGHRLVACPVKANSVSANTIQIKQDFPNEL
jgi:hypothetical protein